MPQTPTPSSSSPATAHASRPDPAKPPNLPDYHDPAAQQPVGSTATAAAAATAPRPPSRSSHLESHTRALTSADRSTVHSPTQKTAPWHPARGVKHEDDDASSSAPGVAPTSHLVPFQPYSNHHQYQYPPAFHEQPQFQPQSAPYLAQGPSPPLPPQGPYPTPAPYAYQQNSFSRTTVNIHLHQQHHYPARAERCDCPDCAAGGMGHHAPPRSAPPLELGRDAPPLSWVPDAALDGEALLEPEWTPGTRQREGDKWQDPQAMAHPQPQMHPQQHISMPALSPAAYAPDRTPYMAEMPRWGNQPFDYGGPPHHQQPQMYPPALHPGPPGPSSSPTVSWSLPAAAPSDPSSSDQPPSPPYVKPTEKPAKHKSRKTWTEVEWKKLTDLAERSKRGNPEADIDWDFVTAGFGGRRCRQGILTVAAKRGLKVSTREARTIGKRGRSTEDADG